MVEKMRRQKNKFQMKKMHGIFLMTILVGGILLTMNLISGATEPSQKIINVGSVSCSWNGNLYVCDCTGDCNWKKESGCFDNNDVKAKIPAGFATSNNPSGCLGAGWNNCCPKSASGKEGCNGFYVGDPSCGGNKCGNLKCIQTTKDSEGSQIYQCCPVSSTTPPQSGQSGGNQDGSVGGDDSACKSFTGGVCVTKNSGTWIDGEVCQTGQGGEIIGSPYSIGTIVSGACSGGANNKCCTDLTDCSEIVERVNQLLVEIPKFLKNKKDSGYSNKMFINEIEAIEGLLKNKPLCNEIKIK